jgi:hypothetical protein
MRVAIPSRDYCYYKREREAITISEKTAATTARGHAPKKPEKNRQIRIVCRSLPVAVAMEKRVKPNMAITIGMRRPFSSDRGAHKVGPNAKPRTKKDTPRMPTSVETPNSAATSLVAAEKMELAKEAVRVV